MHSRLPRDLLSYAAGGVYLIHNGRTAIAFADGHVAMKTGEEMYTSPYKLRHWYTGVDPSSVVDKP